MFKTRFISMLVLLAAVVTGAVAQDTYKIDAVYTLPTGSQDLSIEDAASLPFTKKLSELDPNSIENIEYNIDATNITVSGDNIVKGTDANWDTEITINGAGTATVSYVAQHSDYGVLGSVTITFTVTKNAPAAPAYTVTLKEGTDDATSWTITPAEATTTGVAAGTEVKATYGGTKKVKSVKAKKKAAAAPAPTLAETLTTAGMTVKVNYNYNGGENSCSFLSNGDGTYTFQSGEGNAGDSDRAKALVVEGGKLVFKQNFYSSFDNMYDLFGFSVTFDTSNNTYSLWLGLMAESNVNPSFISVEVNGTQIAVTAAQ